MQTRTAPVAPPDRDSSPFPALWKVGEHIAVAGDTGSGKTYLIAKLVQLRNFVIFFRTKADDIELPGFRKARTADILNDMTANRILLDPHHSHQLREGYRMLAKVWEMGGWTVVIDELWYVENKLKLGEWVDTLLTQGRSQKISVVVGMQRPARVSRFAISQATHVFAFRLEGRDVQIMKEATTPRIVEPIDAITNHDFVYYNRKSRQITSGNARKLGGVITGRATVGDVALPDR